MAWQDRQMYRTAEPLGLFHGNTKGANERVAIGHQGDDVITRHVDNILVKVILAVPCTRLKPSTLRACIGNSVANNGDILVNMTE